ncbi:MAG TPA: 6,7-dimethyl-8-ribityllumazine synthase [Candidatus Paceibacterota bacterium]|jgi:6,7-dimethyl-8-ribityllumazine synthase|nr:6,7-dimethyl-8-ribityllumazine synthase [Candidatus Paceibacterota bacterium]
MQTQEFLKKAKPRDAAKLKVSIVASKFHADITDGMVEGAIAVLKEWKVKQKNIIVRRVYGSFDLPFAAALAIKKDKPDAVIAIGCIVKGETKHDEYIAHAVAQGLMDLSIEHVLPVSLGVITVNNLRQARSRSRGRTNHGEKAAIAALEAALLK